MKTETKSKITQLIGRKGMMRPVELVRALGITPQALHRHLKSLVASGALELRGAPPTTQYALAGTADFSKALSWQTADRAPGKSQDHVCQTRDVFAARLSHLKAYIKQGLPLGELALLVSVTGEIGNNSFDHNLGQWRDVPGCWFESQLTRRRLWICIADRGQGVRKSLNRVDSSIRDDQSALEIAFEKQISGRAPEQRGNGLKYVKSVISGGDQRGLACISGGGRVHYGNLGADCLKILNSHSEKINGTITLLAWELS